MLLNYWICCCNDPDDGTADLYLVLYHCLEIKCLFLKLLVRRLSPCPNPVTPRGCLKPSHAFLGVDLCSRCVSSKAKRQYWAA